VANIRSARRSGFVLRGGRNVRETVWGDVGTVEAVMTGAPTAILINQLNAAALALRPFTVVRVRGVISVRSDQVAATESFIGDLGYAIVSEQAAGIGVTAVPTPLTDKDSDLFFVYQQVIGRINVGSGAGTGVPTDGGVQWIQYDSKAMRKVNESEQMVITTENELSGCNLVHSARFLMKLH